jgi:hypothetical protein
MARRLNGYSTILATAVAILALNPGRAYAQEPATYDYDASTAGVQGPTSPLFANPFTRFFRAISVNVPLLVPAADLQAALPPGFNAVPDALGRASISALFSFQVTNAEHAPATPYQTLVLQAAATNTYLNRVENLVLARFNSSQEAVDAENLTTGGGVWLADFEWEVGQKRGELDILVEIDAGDVGFALRVAATGSAQIDQRVRFDPNPRPFRFVDAHVALDSFWVASMFDQRVVPSTATNLTVSAKADRLELPGGGSLLVLNVGPAFVFSKSQEVWLAFE